MLRLLFGLVLLGTLFYQGEGSFVGQWTDDDNGGFGRSTYVCVVDGQLFGFYSEVGIMRGTVNGNVATGNWYEPGTAQYYEDLEDLAQTTGTFTLTLATDLNSWSGSYRYEGSSTDFLWTAERLDSNVPSDSQCWYSSQKSNAVPGQWRLPEDGTNWWLCQTTEEGQVRYFGTYETIEAGEAYQGSSQGLVKDGIFRGEWISFAEDFGQELIAPIGDQGLRSSWWRNMAHLDAADSENYLANHELNDYAPVNKDASRQDCFAYFSSASSISQMTFLFFCLSFCFYYFLLIRKKIFVSK